MPPKVDRIREGDGVTVSIVERKGNRANRLLAISTLICILAGCATKEASTPLPRTVAGQGLIIKRSLPADLPAESAVFPDSEFVLISTDNATGMLMPVPFVAEAITGALNRRHANALAPKFASIDPYAIVNAAMQGSSLLNRGGDSVVLHPLAFIVDCSDAQFRIALAARIQSSAWKGSYMVHLSTGYRRAALVDHDTGAIAPMRAEMTDAAVTLRRLIEKDAQGELTRPLYKADIGSMHLACSTVSGVLSAKLIRAANVDVVEEGDDYVIVRMPGKLTDPGALGGLMFGLHYLRKDQLDTFRRH